MCLRQPFHQWRIDHCARSEPHLPLPIRYPAVQPAAGDTHVRHDLGLPGLPSRDRGSFPWLRNVEQGTFLPDGTALSAAAHALRRDPDPLPGTQPPRIEKSDRQFDRGVAALFQTTASVPITQLMKQQRTALVITSIAGPNPVLKAFAKGCQRHGIGFILIGDVPSPSDFELPGCDFWSLERQRTMPFELAQLLPERHYGRKNLGYLQAMANGARV